MILSHITAGLNWMTHTINGWTAGLEACKAAVTKHHEQPPSQSSYKLATVPIAPGPQPASAPLLLGSAAVLRDKHGVGGGPTVTIVDGMKVTTWRSSGLRCWVIHGDGRVVELSKGDGGMSCSVITPVHRDLAKRG